MAIKTFGILGAGQMGGGIAHVAAQAGFDVLLADVALSRAEKARSEIDKRLAKAVEKGKLAPELRTAILSRIQPVEGVPALAPSDFIVEAVNEDETLKKQLFRQFDEICRPEVILASNTSSIPITRIAAVTRRPTQVIGMHFKIGRAHV